MTSRKAKGTNVQTQPQAAHIIGLDVGYRNTKAVSDNGTVNFPSVCGHSHEIKFKAAELMEKYPGDTIQDTEGDWFVGNLALKQVPANQLIQLQGRTSNADEFGMAFRLRMMRAALAKLLPYQHGDAVHISIATGLPVDHMPDSAALKAALLGQHLIKANNAHFIANVVDVAVMPQPYGSIYSQMLYPDGRLNPHHTANVTGIVDVGGYTVDVAMDDNGEFIDAQSGSVESGVYTAQERIAAVLEADFRQKPTYEQIETVLRTGYVRMFGEPQDYRVEATEALKPLRDASMALTSRLWRTGMGIDQIYIAGGGAVLVKDVVTRAYRQAVLIKDAQTSNALGYRAYALMKALG